MSFVADLRSELLSIERNPIEDAAEKSPLSSQDVAALRRRCLDLYDELDRSSTFHFRPPPALFNTTQFEASAQAIARELERGLCAGAALPQLVNYAELAWRVFFFDREHESVRQLTRARYLELQRIAQQTLERTDAATAPKNDLATYCFETRLVRRIDGALQLTDIGHALLASAERDAVSWLLWLESKLSMGPNDPLRVSHAVATHLTKHDGFHYISDPNVPDWADEWVFAWNSLQHLVQLGVIARDDDQHDDLTHYRLSPIFRPILVDIAQQRQTPLSLVIDTMLAAERDGIITRTLPSVTPSLSAADAQSQHAKMVVHELRNVLTPVKATLSMVRDRLDAKQSAEAIPLVERVEQSVARLFQFADELGRAAAIVAPEPQLLDVALVVREAIANLNGGVKISYDLALAEDLPRVLGHRDRLALVVINLLRNAAQVSTHATARVRVALDLSAAMDSVRLSVEDDGPGVDEALREAIFQPGFSQRAGGTGHGLALVRQVIEAEMRGTVRCDHGSLGGALFEIILPAVRRD